MKAFVLVVSVCSPLPSPAFAQGVSEGATGSGDAVATERGRETCRHDLGDTDANGERRDLPPHVDLRDQQPHGLRADVHDTAAEWRQISRQTRD